jgi:hypothetical protein
VQDRSTTLVEIKYFMIVFCRGWRKVADVAGVPYDALCARVRR